MPSVYKVLLASHFLPHDLAKKKQYGKISLFDWNGDLSKDWYVYYSFRNEQGKLVRQNNVYGNINTYPTLRERRTAAKIIMEALEDLLKTGVNPTQVRVEPRKKSVADVVSLLESITFTINQAEKLYTHSSYNDFRSRMNRFKTWIIDQGLASLPVQELKAVHVVDYLNQVLNDTSKRNRNNTRLNLSQFFRILKQNQIIEKNIIEDIAVLKTKSKKNKAFTSEQEEQLLALMEQKDKLLSFFIAFVSINILRTVEVCKLRIRDIDVRDKILKVDAKNKAGKTKIIPEILLNLLPDLKQYAPDDFLFTPTGPGPWDAKEANRASHFSKRFTQIKRELGMGKEYNIYSWRHTYITRLYRNLRLDYSPFEAKSRLMLITGHQSMQSLEHYLRDIDAELPEDYSALLLRGVAKNGK